MKILYLVHDLDDNSIWRRVSMLRTGGAEVRVAGFRRGETPLAHPAIDLGRTFNGRFFNRAAKVLRVLLFNSAEVTAGFAPDLILARNLEMLPLARRLQLRSDPARSPKVFYEMLDVHRLMSGGGMVSSALRHVERRLCSRVEGVLISSMRFNDEYLLRFGQSSTAPILVENKVWDQRAPTVRPTPAQDTSLRRPLTIGWFGMLRCMASLQCLDALTRRFEGRVRLVLRGKPAHDALPGFNQLVAANPHIEFHGAYAYPEDLPRIYGEVDIAWLIDRFDPGANSDWLLPNRLYESCAHGVVPLALEGTETGWYLQRHSIGLLLSELRPERLGSVLAQLDGARLGKLRTRIAALDASSWRTTEQDCVRLVRLLAKSTGASVADGVPARNGAMVSSEPAGLAG